jgi:3',5'-cyclic AMP phosphodiesterase CpdA
VLHVAGNHDSVNLGDEALSALWGNPGSLYYSRDAGGMHLVVLHSVETAKRGIQIPDQQLSWLQRDLAATELDVLVFVHHPLSEMDLSGNRWFDGRPHLCRVANRRAVRAILQRCGKVRGVFNGHAHWNHCDVIAGIPYVTLQSLIENVDEDAPGRPARAHAVVNVSKSRLGVRVEGEQPVLLQFEEAPFR